MGLRFNPWYWKKQKIERVRTTKLRMYWKLYFFKTETVRLNQRDLPLKMVRVKYGYKHDRHAVGILGSGTGMGSDIYIPYWLWIQGATTSFC